MKLAAMLSLLALFACGLFALSSYTDSAPVSLDTKAPELILGSPNGGETWYIGDTHNILWTASDLHLVPTGIHLYYTLNGGTTYTPLAEGIPNSGTYPWNMPSVQSYNAKVRVNVLDSFGNLASINSAGVFSITYVPPAIPTGVSVDTSNNLDAMISWDAVTNTIPPYNTPITPDGYIILYNETPYEDEHFFYFLGRSFNTSYTHHDVLEFRNQMYYKVKAYKNYSRGQAEALETLFKTGSGKPLLWKDALEIIHKGAGK